MTNNGGFVKKVLSCSRSSNLTVNWGLCKNETLSILVIKRNCSVYIIKSSILKRKHSCWGEAPVESNWHPHQKEMCLYGPWSSGSGICTLVASCQIAGNIFRRNWRCATNCKINAFIHSLIPSFITHLRWIINPMLRIKTKRRPGPALQGSPWLVRESPCKDAEAGDSMFIGIFL